MLCLQFLTEIFFKNLDNSPVSAGVPPNPIRVRPYTYIREPLEIGLCTYTTMAPSNRYACPSFPRSRPADPCGTVQYTNFYEIKPERLNVYFFMFLYSMLIGITNQWVSPIVKETKQFQ